MLTNKEIAAAKPGAKPFKLFDAGGLYIWVTPTAKSWRYKYRIAGKEKTLSLGQYPHVGLAEARERHADARKQVSSGIDPSAEKRKARQVAVIGGQNTLKSIAEAWFAEITPHRSVRWRERMRYNLDTYLIPVLGSRPIDAVSPADILEMTKEIAKEFPYTGRFLQQMLTRIFAYAVRNLKTKHNPARELEGTIVVPAPVHYTALEPSDLPALHSALTNYPGRPATALGIRELLLTIVRKVELREAEWSEFDLDAGIWIIPANRMKGRREHMVPLSTQAIAIFRELQTLAFGSRFVLPNLFDPSKPISHSTFNAVFTRHNIKASPHGVRACFSTWANEHGYRPDVIETCLAHAERNSVRGAYNRAMYWPERRKIMQDWADYVEGVSQPQSNVTSIEDRFPKRA